MTPKEKAQELFDKFELSFAGVISADEDWEALGKQCALIAVDEIISADWYIPTFEDYKKWTSYWKEVKQEIENL